MRNQDGFTIVGLMIVVAVVNVALAVAVTSWVSIDRRAREAELLFRGQAIARAIDCYRRGDAGKPLLRLEQLVQANCLRHLYRDPFSRDGQWHLLRQHDLADGTVAALLGQAPPESAPGAARGTAAGAGLGAAPGAASTIAGLLRGSSALRARQGTGASSGDGIIGVVSRGTGASLRSWRGRQKYGEWVFLASGS